MEVYAGSGRGAGSVGGCARSARSHLFFFDAWIQASKEIKLIDDRGAVGIIVRCACVIVRVCMYYC